MNLKHLKTSHTITANNFNVASNSMFVPPNAWINKNVSKVNNEGNKGAFHKWGATT